MNGHKVEFNTTDYHFAHGHTPRGKGSWAFSYRRNWIWSDIMWAPANSTFTEAKKWMTKKAQQLSHADVRSGRVTVYVCS